MALLFKKVFAKLTLSARYDFSLTLLTDTHALVTISWATIIYITQASFEEDSVAIIGRKCGNPCNDECISIYSVTSADSGATLATSEFGDIIQGAGCHLKLYPEINWYPKCLMTWLSEGLPWLYLLTHPTTSNWVSFFQVLSLYNCHWHS